MKFIVFFGLFANAMVAASASAQGLTGEVRDGFVQSGLPECIKSAKDSLKSNQELFDKAGISSNEHIIAFCQCMLGKTADQVTPEELGQLGRRVFPDSMKAKTQANGKLCAPALFGQPTQ